MSYSFPSSYGPIVKPASWICGQLRLIIILTGEFSKTKSASRMGEDDFDVVKLDVVPFSLRKDDSRKAQFSDLKLAEETEVNSPF